MTATNRQRMAAWTAVLGGAAMSLALLSGCPSESQDPSAGYSAAPLHSTKVGSVFVEMFKVAKTEFRRGYEFRLTEALAKRISSDTDLRIATKATADTIISGEIRNIAYGVLSETSAKATRETQITVTASVQWKDQRTGEILMEAPDLEASADFIPSLGEDQYRGSQAAIEKLARRIVERMESQW